MHTAMGVSLLVIVLCVNVFIIDTHMTVCSNNAAKPGLSTGCEMQNDKMEIGGGNDTISRGRIDTPDAVYK